MTPTIGSLFSGYGGLEMGMSYAWDGDLRLAWHSETDPDAAAVLAAHWPDVPSLGDITAVDWGTVPRVDIVCAGWPCQPFSVAGKRKGRDDDRALWPYVAGAIRHLRPRHVFLENVAAITGGSGELERALGDLASLGFDAEWGVFRASDAGAPHRRARCFIVATDAARELRDGTGQAGQAGRDEHPNRSCAPADADYSGPQGKEPEERRNLSAGGSRSPADAKRLVVRDESGWCSGQGGSGSGVAGHDGKAEPLWGKWEPAIRRWERTIGRPAPDPRYFGPRGGKSVNPRFVEWMMGLPDGWVTVPVPGKKALRVLGNGVVPKQAALAWRMLGGAA